MNGTIAFGFALVALVGMLVSIPWVLRSIAAQEPVPPQNRKFLLWTLSFWILLIIVPQVYDWLAGR